MAWRFYDDTGAEKVIETSGGGGGGDPTMGGDLTGTASTAQIATGAIVNADVNVAAAIALSKLATDPLARANHTGTQLASTVSDFDTQVRTSRLDQMALPTAAVPMGSQKLTGLAAGSSNGDSLRYEQLIGQYLLLAGGTLTGNLSVANDLTVNHASGTSQVFINALAAQESVLKLRSGGTTMWSLSRQPTSDDFWMYNQTAGATAFTIAKTTNIVDFNETPTKDGSTIWHAGNDGAASTLDADLLDAQHGTYYLARANHSGTQLASTISDFDTQVRTSRLDQMALPTAAVPMGSQKITGLAAGTANGDAVRYEQLIGQYLLLAGGTLSGDVATSGTASLNMGGTGTLWLNTNNSLRMSGRLNLRDDEYTGSSAISAIGQHKAYTGSGGHTLTFPTLTSSTNSTFFIHNIGTGQVTVSRASTNTIILDGVTGQTSFTLDVGESCLVYHRSSANTEWVVFRLGGTGSGSSAAADITIVDAAGDFTATNVEDALAELQSDAEADATALSDHISDTTAAHAASAVSVNSATLVGTGTDVQAVFEELDNSIADHLADATDAHAGTAITNTPAGNIAATTVQAAINELDTDKSAVGHAHAAGDVTSGTFATARLGANTANSDRVLRGDSEWAFEVPPHVAMLRAAGCDMKAAVCDPLGPNTTNNMVDGSMMGHMIIVPYDCTITGVWFNLATAGSITADNNNKVALFTFDGTNLTCVAASANNTTVWHATANTYAKEAFTSTYAASAGIYVVARLSNWSAAATTPSFRCAPNIANSALANAFLATNVRTSFTINRTNIAVSDTIAWSGTANTSVVSAMGLY